jgi:hypothetical protein
MEIFNPQTGEVFEDIGGELVLVGSAFSIGPEIPFLGTGGGMSGLGDWPTPDVSGQTRPRTVGTPRSSTQDNIFAAIAGGLTVLNNWVISRPGANPSLATQFTNGQTMQQGLTQAQLAQLLAAQQQNQLASASADSGGINIGGTRISFPVLMIAIVGLVLLQSGGFSRR